MDIKRSIKTIKPMMAKGKFVLVIFISLYFALDDLQLGIVI